MIASADKPDIASMSMDDVVHLALAEHLQWLQQQQPSVPAAVGMVFVSTDWFEAYRKPFKRAGRWYVRAKGAAVPLATPRRAFGDIVFELGD